MSRAVRASSAAGNLLLVVVLALGVFLMHTLGHPDMDHGSGGGHAVSASESASASASASHGGHEPVAAPAASAPAEKHGTDAHEPPPGGFDPMSVCLAVLFGFAALLFAALLRAALARRLDWAAALRERLTGALRAHAPPRPPDLAQLSILRI